VWLVEEDLVGPLSLCKGSRADIFSRVFPSLIYEAIFGRTAVK
jgi:hypothetical protein